MLVGFGSFGVFGIIFVGFGVIFRGFRLVIRGICFFIFMMRVSFSSDRAWLNSAGFTPPVPYIYPITPYT